MDFSQRKGRKSSCEGNFISWILPTSLNQREACVQHLLHCRVFLVFCFLGKSRGHPGFFHQPVFIPSPPDYAVISVSCFPCATTVSTPVSPLQHLRPSWGGYRPASLVMKIRESRLSADEGAQERRSLMLRGNSPQVSRDCRTRCPGGLSCECRSGPGPGRVA